MERQGITGDAAEQIIRSITSFALYGFPESHSASFALLVYASTYLKAHYPAAFFTAMLNNQPMGFYHPATLVKDAQRHGVSFLPIDIQSSDWECRVDADGRVRLGMMYVNGLRAETGRAIAGARESWSGVRGPRSAGSEEPQFAVRGPQSAVRFGATRTSGVEYEGAGADRCPKCGNDDQSLLEDTQEGGRFCNICAHQWGDSRSDVATPVKLPGTRTSDPGHVRFASIEDLIARTGIRRDELATLAEIGALNTFGHDRRSALWQIERAARPAGELFAGQDVEDGPAADAAAGPEAASAPPARSPLQPMTASERLVSDYSGSGLTIGPHPLALRRMELALRGILRAIDLPRGRHGRRVRIAGAVITRQRPGTAKGFVFLTLEDETGIANIIVRPDLFTEQRSTIIGAPYLMVEGILQIQEGVTSVKAERVVSLADAGPEPQARDFH
jgi:error-prone DNA polymerase